MWENLSKKLKSLLKANTLIQEVYDYEPSNFGGDPVATLVPSSNESDYSTTAENERVYAFMLTLWIKRTDKPNDEAKVEAMMRELVDSVLDDLDKSYTLGAGTPGDSLVSKTGYDMLYMEASPSSWVYTDRETLYRGAEIDLRIHFDVNVNLIN